jgi:G2/mitotic-specific cyclin 2
LAYYAGYTEDEVEPVVHLMVDYLARPVCHEAFFKKYASKKFLKGMLAHDLTIQNLIDADMMIASILARGWAKKSAAAFGLTDLDLSLDQIS